MKVKAEVKSEVKSKMVQKVKKEEKDIRKEIKTLLDTISESWYYLSQKLYEVYTGDLFKTWGYNSFEDYSKEELSMEYRIAMFYVQIGQAIKKFGIPEDKVRTLGWTKFKELTYLFKEGISKEEIDNYIDEVKTKSYTEIKDFVKTERVRRAGGDTSVIEKAVKLEFRLKKDQAELVQTALKESMGLINSDNEGMALVYICVDWMMTKSPTPQNLDQIIPKEQEEVKLERKEKVDKTKRKERLII
jgi:hypothetical protein